MDAYKGNTYTSDFPAVVMHRASLWDRKHGVHPGFSVPSSDTRVMVKAGRNTPKLVPSSTITVCSVLFVT